MSRGRNRFKSDQILIDSKLTGSNIITTHAQDIDSNLEHAKRIRQGNDSNGFSDNRTMRHIGHIPAAVIQANPALLQAQLSGDSALFGKMCEIFLKTDEGKPYATVTRGI